MTGGYPVALDVTGKAAVVVGGGTVALRRARALAEAGAEVTVIAPEVAGEIAALPVSVRRRRYRDGDLAGAWFAHAATSDPAVNAAVAAEAGRERIWCARADDATASAATMPAVTRHGDVTVAVTSGGDPRRSQALRAAIAALLAAGELTTRPVRPADGRPGRGHRRPRRRRPGRPGADHGPRPPPPHRKPTWSWPTGWGRRPCSTSWTRPPR